MPRQPVLTEGNAAYGGFIFHMGAPSGSGPAIAFVDALQLGVRDRDDDLGGRSGVVSEADQVVDRNLQRQRCMPQPFDGKLCSIGFAVGGSITVQQHAQVELRHAGRYPGLR